MQHCVEMKIQIDNIIKIVCKYFQSKTLQSILNEPIIITLVNQLKC